MVRDLQFILTAVASVGGLEAVEAFVLRVSFCVCGAWVVWAQMEKSHRHAGIESSSPSSGKNEEIAWSRGKQGTPLFIKMELVKFLLITILFDSSSLRLKFLLRFIHWSSKYPTYSFPLKLSRSHLNVQQ